MGIGSIGNSCLNIMFGNGNDLVVQSIRHSIGNRKAHNQSYIKALCNGTCDGFVRSHIRNERSGGFFHCLKSNLKNIRIDFKNGGLSLKGLKSITSGIGKALPIAFATFGLIQDVPNIIKATKEKGWKQGAKETLKTFAKLATASVFSIFPTALIKIPILSNTYGYFLGEQIGGKIGDGLADLVIGKSYTDKIEKQQKKQEKIEPNNTPSKINKDTRPEIDYSKNRILRYKTIATLYEYNNINKNNYFI